MPSDAAFREAVTAYDKAMNAYICGHPLSSAPTTQQDEARITARQRLLDLYAEREGEEYEVGLYLVDGMYLPMVLFPDAYKMGDRVTVRRCGEGDK